MSSGVTWKSAKPGASACRGLSRHLSACRRGLPRRVESALALGYRHIDTANDGNERCRRRAIAASRVARGNLHVTTKVWHENLPGCDPQGVRSQLKKLKLDHVDLYLVHWPSKKYEPAGDIETLLKLIRKSHPRHRRRQFQHCAIEDRVEQVKGAGRLQPDRVSRDARSEPMRKISLRPNRSRSSLRAAGTGPRRLR